jgi:2-polyprenyl-6-hydroxyphenyl methylase/3-demethylubiquinone-9 3-methyltransferase
MVFYEIRKSMAEKQGQSVFRKFLRWNRRASCWFDRVMMPTYFQVHGQTAFQNEVAAPYVIKKDLVIYDVGGGSRPYITLNHKNKYDQTLVGLDIDAAELDAAPQGLYDEKIAVDLTQYQGKANADVIICQAALEHVHDNAKSFAAMTSILKPGGYLCIFTPSRHAIFARLNMMLPQELKKKILFKLFPHKAKGHDGFKAYYDQCTPDDFQKLAAQNGFEVVEIRAFYKSTYFEICFPIYVIWRLWQLLFKAIAGDNAAETFTMVLKKSG